jgi:hypothetical protein
MTSYCEFHQLSKVGWGQYHTGTTCDIILKISHITDSKSIPGSAQYVTLQKYFSRPFLFLLFCKPTHKTETRTANGWETTNSKSPKPIIMIGWSEIESSSQIIFITLFSGRCTALLCFFISLSKLCETWCWVQTQQNIKERKMTRKTQEHKRKEKNEGPIRTNKQWIICTQ